jgi:hypothetical protein
MERMKTVGSRGVLLHPDAVTQNGPAGERRRGVDRHYCHLSDRFGVGAFDTVMVRAIPGP